MAKQPKRKIIRIDEEKCDGCGQCIPSCAEGALKIVDGKARLVAEVYCDGMGACLGHCPQGAITIEERPAEAFDPEAVETRKRESAGIGRPAHPTGAPQAPPHRDPPHRDPPHRAPAPVSARPDTSGERATAGTGGGTCPGAVYRELSVLGAGGPDLPSPGPRGPQPQGQGRDPGAAPDTASRLTHWPVQLALVPVAGRIWQDADVLIAADCVAFAMPDFHERLLAGKSVAVACPKLDELQPHVEKLAMIFSGNRIRSVTVAHMEVPCCSGIVHAVRMALEMTGKKDLPFREITVGVDGRVL